MKLKQIRVDGYKNLINAVLDLGDFNVLVGPNNSGKSNLLEAIQMLGPICFGDDKIRGYILKGMTPPPRGGSSLCHLEKYRNKMMTIGVTFEITNVDIAWLVDYEIKLQCSHDKKEDIGFVSETLTAKEPSKTGPPTTYIKREEKILRVEEEGQKKGSHPISKDNSSMLALRSLYPDFEKLPSELKMFINAISSLGSTDIFALSPSDVRDSLYRDKSIEGPQISSFSLPFVVDKIKEEGKYYELFKQTLCDILALEGIEILARDISIPSQSQSSEYKTQGKEKLKRIRFFLAQRKGDIGAFIEEYSDGTLVVAAILAILLSKGRTEPIICIEELENYLHPVALEKLLRFLQDHADKWPVLITTHSPYLLNGVNPEDVNVAIVDEDGATHFEKVKNTKQLRDYLNKGFMSFGDLLSSNFENVIGRK
jgi:energy-coupling factor transporter ATP-binding protein EcfA2